MKKLIIILLLFTSGLKAQDKKLSWMGSFVTSSGFVNYNYPPVAVIDSVSGSYNPDSTLTIHATITDVEGDSCWGEYRFGFSPDSLGSVTWLTSYSLDSTYTIPDSLAGNYPYMSVTPIALTGGRTGREVYAYGDLILNAQAKALIDRMDVWPTKDEMILISDMVDSLQLYHIWDTAYAIYFTGMPTVQQARQNWKADTFNLYGAVPFTAYYGFTGDGSHNLNTWFIPANNSRFAQNSACFAIGLDSVAGGTGGYNGATKSSPTLSVMIVPSLTGNATGRINANTNLTTANTRTNAVIIANRILSTEQELYINGTRYEGAQASVAPIGYALSYLALNQAGTINNFSTLRMNFGYIGGGLTEAQAVKLTELARWFTTQMRVLGLLAMEDSESRTALFNQLLAGGDKTVTVDLNDTIKLNSTVFIDSRTTLNFEAGTVITKDASYCNVFLNEGAMTKTFNSDITIDGLNLSVKKYESPPDLIHGLRANIAFFCIRNLWLTNFTCLDFDDYQFGIEVVNFDSVVFDGITILNSDKDCIDFFGGHNGTIRNCTLDSRDDATYIGGSGWAITSPPAVGDLYDMTFTNINWSYSGDEITVGRGMYVMCQSWADWAADSTYQTGDMCVYDSAIYMCANAAGFSGVAANAPVHTDSIVTYADGIAWNFMQYGEFYHLDVHDITIDSSSYDGCTNLLMIPSTNSVNHRNIYPGTEDSASVYNITVKNTTVRNTTGALIGSNVKDVTFENCTFDSLSYFIVNVNPGVNVDSTIITSTNNSFNYVSTYFLYAQTRKLIFTSSGDTYTNTTFTNRVYGTTPWTGKIRVVDNPTLPFTALTNLTPLTGDKCTSLTGYYEWDGNSWEETE